MKFILGKKLDMTQVWKEDNVVGVTRVQAGPCVVVQVKSEDKDGYSAVQVGFGKRQAKNIAKPQLNHMKGLDNFRYLREFRSFAKATEGKSGFENLKRGDKIDVSSFEVGDNIQVTGVSKGKGFQGVVKRHGFHGQDKTHGNKDQLRMPGSIGATGPAHVFKGQKMPGRMGGDQVTVKNSEVIEIDNENNILLIKGAVPGARNGLVLISGEGELKLKVESQKVRKVESRGEETNKTADSRQQTAEKKDFNKVENFIFTKDQAKKADSENDNRLDKERFLKENGITQDDRNKGWYDEEKPIFSHEFIDDSSLEHIKSVHKGFKAKSKEKNIEEVVVSSYAKASADKEAAEKVGERKEVKKEDKK